MSNAAKAYSAYSEIALTALVSNAPLPKRLATPVDNLDRFSFTSLCKTIPILPITSLAEAMAKFVIGL
jgi:hypothetical protein